MLRAAKLSVAMYPFSSGAEPQDVGCVQVQLLQYQLQAMQAMQSMPLMVASPYAAAYQDPWRTPAMGMHWPPPQSVLPMFSQAPAASVVSVQHSCSMVAGAGPAAPAMQPPPHFLAAASSQGSPGAVSVAAAEGPATAAALGSPGSDSGLISAFREPQSPTAAAAAPGLPVRRVWRAAACCRGSSQATARRAGSSTRSGRLPAA